ncbi:oxalurate catabolism protein HpxZ [Parvibaculum sp.]|uniref:oxalurate catabolism protein HpxZ n=1 Tax=Parvibaculum sp. TaxID=2024848 RepID=UPI003210E8D2
MSPSISLSFDAEECFDEAIDDEEVVAEVRAVFDRYEKALMENDVDVLDELFWQNARTIRYGAGENLYGFDEIAAFRSGRNAAKIARKPLRVEISTYGRNFATANCEYQRLSDEKCGRQSQTWVRFPEGWRVISAHVSFLPEAKPAS